jgi:glutathionyl-hydroquinone reductase
MKIPLRVTCKQATALLIAKEDRRIAMSDQVALRLHLYACKACPNFEHQLIVMRKSMKLWRNYGAEITETTTSTH